MIKTNFKKLIKLTILTISIIISSVPAQTQDAKFTNFTQEDGLPSSQIHRLLQDHMGYIWVGSVNGLALFDGYTYTQFVKDVEDSTSIQTEFVSSLR